MVSGTRKDISRITSETVTGMGSRKAFWKLYLSRSLNHKKEPVMPRGKEHSSRRNSFNFLFDDHTSVWKVTVGLSKLGVKKHKNLMLFSLIVFYYYHSLKKKKSIENFNTMSRILIRTFLSC